MPDVPTRELGRRGVAAQEIVREHLLHAVIPLILILLLTGVRIAAGSFSPRGTTILLVGGIAAAVTMFIYPLPTLFRAYGRRPAQLWVVVATALGIIPLLYGVWVVAVGGAWGAFRATSIGEAGIGILLLLAGFYYLRAYSRLAQVGLAIEKAASPGSGDGPAAAEPSIDPADPTDSPPPAESPEPRPGGSDPEHAED